MSGKALTGWWPRKNALTELCRMYKTAKAVDRDFTNQGRMVTGVSAIVTGLDADGDPCGVMLHPTGMDTVELLAHLRDAATAVQAAIDEGDAE